MDREQMIEVLKMNRDLAMFNPMTGECRPMNELNAESAEALDMAIKELVDKDTNVPTKWIPVTPDTMPEENRVVVVCGEKGTWDYGTYRGHLNSINNWNWKKNTAKTVYWWMYKEDALPMPWKGEVD